jgi:hypothetical protein
MWVRSEYRRVFYPPRSCPDYLSTKRHSGDTYATRDPIGTQKLVIRTGGGVYYDRFQGNRVFDFVRNPPWASSLG